MTIFGCCILNTRGLIYLYWKYSKKLLLKEILHRCHMLKTLSNSWSVHQNVLYNIYVGQFLSMLWKQKAVEVQCTSFVCHLAQTTAQLMIETGIYSICFVFCEKKSLSLTMITFDNVEAAQRALATLNGQDIYAGCCTLKIDYSKVKLCSKI